MGQVSLIDHLYSQLTEDFSRLKFTIAVNKFGSFTLFKILDFLPDKRMEFVHTLTHCFIDMFKLSDDLSHLLDPLFMLYRPGVLMPLLDQVAMNFFALSRHDFGIKNLYALMGSTSPMLQQYFVSQLRPNFWTASYSRAGCDLLKLMISPALLSKLKGSFYDLSIHRYANWLVKNALDKADLETLQSIATELDSNARRLVTHEFGNYVIQHLIRKFYQVNLLLPPHLSLILNNDRRQLQGNSWGRSVVMAYDIARRS